MLSQTVEIFIRKCNHVSHATFCRIPNLIAHLFLQMCNHVNDWQKIWENYFQRVNMVVFKFNYYFTDIYLQKNKNSNNCCCVATI